MNEGNNNLAIIAVIVVCLSLGGTIGVALGGGPVWHGEDAYPEGSTVTTYKVVVVVTPNGEWVEYWHIDGKWQEYHRGPLMNAEGNE